MTENDVLGFNPQDLFKQEDESKTKKYVNPNIYKMKPAESVDEDGIYRATIKVVYNPFNRTQSFLEQQSYGLNDARGFFEVVSALTLNNEESRNCPIFKAWKKCRYSEEGSVLWRQQAKLEEGGKALFDKRQARYCIVQILEDKNQPDLVGSFKIWKIPSSIYKLIKQKQDPTDPKKAAIPVMDYLFGRSIDIEVYPGPDDKANPQRKTREIDYRGEISEDEVSCINPDGSPLLTTDENEILETYISAMKKVWKSKDPDERAKLLEEVLSDANTEKFRTIYARVLEQIKGWSPDLSSMGYKEWSPEVKARVQSWIDVVLSGNDPKSVSVDGANTPKIPEGTATTNTQTETKSTETSSASVESGDDDLPF